MFRPSLLTTAIVLAAPIAQAAPFMPLDARGMAMGQTGVASAQRAHAPAYNPSLLSQADAEDDFALIFPQLGVQVRDQEELASTAEEISDDLQPELERLLDGESQMAGFEEHIDALDQAVRAFDVAVQQALNGTLNVDERLEDLSTASTNLDKALDDVQASLRDVDDVAGQLSSALRSISGHPVSGRLGASAAMAFPSKDFAAAVSVRGHALFSGRALFSDNDLGLIDAYAPAGLEYSQLARDINADVGRTVERAQGSATPEVILLAELNRDDDNNGVPDLEQDLEEVLGFDYTSDQGVEIFRNGQLTDNAADPDLDSRVEIIAATIAEVGVSFSREFTLAERPVAIGITPKLQKISTYHYVSEVDNEEEIEIDDFEDTREDYSSFNLDVGASMRFGPDDSLTAGLVIKNLLGGDYDYQSAPVRTGIIGDELAVVEGGSVSLDPQYRAGLAYSDDTTTLALDLDLLENDPVAYEDPTQYIAFGAEFDLWDTVQLRGGYRANIAATDSDVVSFGFGISPFGIHLDVAAMANPSKLEKEAGVALETGFYF
jgi:hypothetical protein